MGRTRAGNSDELSDTGRTRAGNSDELSDTGRTRAGNSDELSDTGRARAYILGLCRALPWTTSKNLGPKMIQTL